MYKCGEVGMQKEKAEESSLALKGCLVYAHRLMIHSYVIRR